MAVVMELIFRSFSLLQFLQPPRSRSIRIYEEGRGEVITVDVSLPTSPVTYPSTSFGQTLTFQTNFAFTEKKRYYVLLDPGIDVINN